MENELILKEKTLLIEEDLRKHLEIKYPEKIYEAMNYSIFAGGKRLRPLLMLSVCESVGGNLNDCITFASAIEMIHTYSLVHDDMPCMDNDDYRRGVLTNHKKFSEGIALLVGDALLNKAFEIMSDVCAKDFYLKNILALKEISRSSGVLGMIGGQVVDVLSEGKDIDKNTLIYIHENKTAALISASIVSGALLGGINLDKIQIYRDLGTKIGILFQIKDDILDITSTQEILGKPTNSDYKNNKKTYVSVLGMEQAIIDYNNLTQEVLQILDKIEYKNEFLFFLVKMLIKREN